MTVGISGKYCSGKNEVVRIFEEYGFYVVDVDRLGHTALEVLRREVTARFGERILSEQGTIDRKKLGDLVFKDRKRLTALENIVHPFMKERVEDILRKTKRPAVINAALLFTMGLDALCDRIVIVKAPLLERINRALDRDNLGMPAILRRILLQRKLIPQSSFLPADTIIVENAGTRAELRDKVSALIPRLAG